MLKLIKHMIAFWLLRLINGTLPPTREELLTFKVDRYEAETYKNAFKRALKAKEARGKYWREQCLTQRKK